MNEEEAVISDLLFSYISKASQSKMYGIVRVLVGQIFGRSTGGGNFKIEQVHFTNDQETLVFKIECWRFVRCCALGALRPF